MNAENISYSKIEGSSNLLNVTSKSAILQPNEWLSYYDLDDNLCYESCKNKLISSNGIYSLNLNPNGGGFFYISDSEDSKIWASDPSYLDPDLLFCCMIPRDLLIMEENGNLVFYEREGKSYDGNGQIVSEGKKSIRWQSNTTGEGNYAILKDDGKLVIFNKENKIIWSSS